MANLPPITARRWTWSLPPIAVWGRMHDLPPIAARRLEIGSREGKKQLEPKQLAARSDYP